MKNLFKFTSAALALVAFASCSNDDLLGGQNIAGQGDKGTLVVNVEPLSDGFRSSTRALSNDALTSLNFEASDKIKVYDSEVHKWDGYQFNKTSKKFELFTESDLTAAEFALYPFGPNDGGYEGQYEDGNETGVTDTDWSKGGVTTATMAIPHSYFYKESTLADGSNGYWCNLPMWGTVTSTEGKLETNLKYMTAVLRVSLKNVTSSNVHHLRIQAFKDESRTKQIRLSGEFEAVLDTEDPANTALQEELGEDDIIINLAEADNADSYVFVPIVPCTNAIVVIKYEDDTNAPVAGKDGKTEKVLSQKNYVRGTLYKAKGAEFDVTIDAPSAITKALMGAKAETEPVEINATEITVTDLDDNVITIPSGMTADITLNLTGINTTANELYIEDENSSNPYAGNLTVITDAATEGVKKIITQLKGAAVKFVGDYSATPFDIYAKELVIGETEKATTASLATIGATVEAIVVAKDATVDAITAPADNKLAEVLVEGTVTDKIQAAANKDIATAITIDGGSVLGSGACAQTYGDITVKGEANVGVIRNYAAKDVTYPISVNVSGKAVVKAIRVDAVATVRVSEEAKVTTFNTPKSSVTLLNSKETVYTGAITANYLSLNEKSVATGAITTGKLVIQGEASVVNATVSDNVYVKLSKEGEAISGTLTIGTAEIENTKGMQIGLHNGYINAIDLTDAKYNVALKTSAAQVAIAKVTVAGGDDAAQLVPEVTSKWDGKKISDAFAKYGKAAQVWTASQLASFAATAKATLMTDIDLDGKAWTMPSLKAGFDGNGKTISNLYLEAAATKTASVSNIGLFATVDASVAIISSLTLDGVTSKITVAADADKLQNVGALIGLSNASIVLYEVNVKNASLTSDAKIENVGGLVGQIAEGKNAWIGFTEGNESKKSDKAMSVSSTIKGKYYLGGLVGKAGGNLNINKTTVAAAFTVVDAAEPGLSTATSADAGSVGMFAGAVNGNVVTDANSFTEGVINGHRDALGFWQNYKKEDTNVWYYYGGYEGVGLWNGTTEQTLKIGDAGAVTVVAVEQLAEKSTVAGHYRQYIKTDKWDK